MSPSRRSALAMLGGAALAPLAGLPRPAAAQSATGGLPVTGRALPGKVIEFIREMHAWPDGDLFAAFG
jgi:hypothetical protein